MLPLPEVMGSRNEKKNLCLVHFQRRGCMQCSECTNSHNSLDTRQHFLFENYVHIHSRFYVWERIYSRVLCVYFFPAAVKLSLFFLCFVDWAGKYQKWSETGEAEECQVIMYVCVYFLEETMQCATWALKCREVGAVVDKRLDLKKKSYLCTFIAPRFLEWVWLPIYILWG